MKFAAWFFFLLFATGPAAAHEVRPGYLDIRETAPTEYSVLWKVPAIGDRRLAIYARLPRECREKSAPISSFLGGAHVERRAVACDNGIAGREILIEGLGATATDVLVRVEHAGGVYELARLTPAAPAYIVAGVQSSREIARTYFLLGLEHILAGIDHLLFVLALLLLIRDPWALVKAVTAFTVAHSITLAMASLGLFDLPGKPVEAVIALSIVFLAVEIVKSRPDEKRLSERFPWLIAFAFGLLHGFGFAGALSEIGLPQSDVPLALLTFNLGVEAGQLLFIAVMLSGIRIFRDFSPFAPAAVRTVLAYAIGITATFWLYERLAGFVA